MRDALRSKPESLLVSGTHAIGIGRLRAAMLRHVSPLLVDSVLERAIRHHVHGDIDGETLAAVTEDCMLGLRLFVDEHRLPELMLELAEILEGKSG
jgi:hypothetical protein